MQTFTAVGMTTKSGTPRKFKSFIKADELKVDTRNIWVEPHHLR